jgi:hypothetical protein
MCLSPIFIRDRFEFVPCGKCSECIKNASQTWIYRCKYELSKSDVGIAVTLTYENDSLPFVEVVDPDTGEYDYTPGFNKEHLQKFFKRLRKILDVKGITFRYLVISEYGGTTDRPHYHGLFFFRNVPEEYNIVMKLEDMILKEWYYGHCYFDSIDEPTIAYVTKYVLKDKEPPPHSMKPFALYSRRPGIGMDYVTDNAEWHKGEYDRQFFKPLESNVKIPLNYYIKSKLYNLTKGSYDRIQLDIRKKQHDLQKYSKAIMYDKAYSDIYINDSYSSVEYRQKVFNNNEFFKKLEYRKFKEKI